MTRLQPLPEEIGARPFTLTEAALAGIPANRLLGNDLHLPSRGIRVPKSGAHSLHALARSHTQLDEDTFASLLTAAEVLDVPLPTWAQFRPDDGGPVTAVVEPVPGGKKSAPTSRSPAASCTFRAETQGRCPGAGASQGTGSGSATATSSVSTDCC